MIRNIPMRFNRTDLLNLIDQRYSQSYDYFYLPIDLKTFCNRGYAYINFTDPMLLLDFYLEFQSLKWNVLFQSCNSQKTCMLHYAYVQGKDANIAMLANKNIMKKEEEGVRPIIK